MSHNASLDMSARFSVPAEYVWFALTTPTEVAHWWPDLQLQRRKGSKFRLVAPRPRKKRPRTIEGKLISPAKAPYVRAVVHSHPRNYATELTIYVSQLPSATRLRILEAGFPERDNANVIVAECRDGWRAVVNALRAHLENEETVTRIRALLDS